MRKFIFLALVFFTLISCKNNSDIQTEQSVPETLVMSKSESNQKLIEVCENMDGVVDADIKDDILTIRANMSKIEAQKLSVGMLSEIRKFNQDINAIMVVDLEYQLLGYSEKN